MAFRMVNAISSGLLSLQVHGQTLVRSKESTCDGGADREDRRHLPASARRRNTLRFSVIMVIVPSVILATLAACTSGP